MNLWRRLNSILVLGFASVFIFTEQYLSLVCGRVGCDPLLEAGILSTWNYAGRYAMFFLLLFFVFPASYFRAYVYCIVSWLLPLTVLVIAASDPFPTGRIRLERPDLVNLWALIWVVSTLVFLVLHYHRERRRLTPGE
jgi:hypothetical protein